MELYVGYTNEKHQDGATYGAMIHIRLRLRLFEVGVVTVVTFGCDAEG
jgi:hypothetical protein